MADHAVMPIPPARLSDDRLRRLASIAEENIDRGYGNVELLGSLETSALIDEVIEARSSQGGTPRAKLDEMSESFLTAEILRHTIDSRGHCACGHRYVVLGWGVEAPVMAAHIAKAITEAGWRRA